MADKVSVYIEKMKMDLLYYIKKGVFTKDDAREIIKERETYGSNLIKNIL